MTLLKKKTSSHHVITNDEYTPMDFVVELLAKT